MSEPGAWPGPCRPSCEPLANGGSAGAFPGRVTAAVAVRATGAAADFLAVVVDALLGGDAATSAANPAVRPAEPRMTQRRVWPTRASAASRARAASTRVVGVGPDGFMPSLSPARVSVG